MAGVDGKYDIGVETGKACVADSLSFEGASSDDQGGGVGWGTWLGWRADRGLYVMPKGVLRHLLWQSTFSPIHRSNVA